MLQILWDTRGYFFWMLVVSLGCILLEAFWPWRKEQKQLRRQIGQDFFWLIFNAHYVGLAVGFAAAKLLFWLAPATESAESWNLISNQPLMLQFVVFFVLKDLLEWCVHNLLHRIPFLWAFHKVHHSIEVMDWIGNFRFHWMEVVVYKSLTYFPLAVLGVDGRIVLWIAILTTIIGHLNHSNLDISWGPLRYLVNSSRMHVWHHMYDLPEDRGAGVNFGISLSVWDWLFGTSYWPSREAAPAQQPERLGFPEMDQYPHSLIGRFFYPFSILVGKAFRRRRDPERPS